MKRILTLASVISILAACGNQGKPSSTDISATEEALTPSQASYYVVGDSLCYHATDSWPVILKNTGYDIRSNCVPGKGVVKSGGGEKPLDIEEILELKGQASLIVAIGVNDANLNSDPEAFIAKYSLLVEQDTICVLPPLSQRATLQPKVEILRALIISVCPTIVYPAESDHPDGLHYTLEAQQLNAEIIATYLTSAP